MSENNEKYDLYTEKIKGKPFMKYRKYINFVKILMVAALAGVVAGVCFTLVVSITSGGLEDSGETRRPVSIPLDELSATKTDTVANVDVDLSQGQTAQTNPIDTTHKDVTSEELTLESMGNDVYEYVSARSDIIEKSMVTIAVIEENEDPVLSLIRSQTNRPGIIIADNDIEYLILTDYSVNKADMLRVTFVDGESMTGTFIMGDKTTDVAIIAVAHSDMPDATREAIDIAQMGNSYMLGAGELVIAMGNLYGIDGAVDFGSSISTAKIAYEEDSRHGLVYTNINAGDDCNGFIFTSEGKLIGTISNERSANSVIAYGISDIKLRIQNLSNRQQIGYVGIIGQEVTDELSDSYGMPSGVYVTSVVEYSPAYYAGIANGDVITDIEGKLITNVYNIERTMCEFEPGTEVKITVYRRGRDGYVPIEYTVTLGER